MNISRDVPRSVTDPAIPDLSCGGKYQGNHSDVGI